MTASTFLRRALVVEDDTLTRSLVSTLLTMARFEVLGVPSAREALMQCEEFDPDVLVVDIQLAERPNGAQLATALAETIPQLAIVVVSHYPNPRAAGLHHPLPGRVAFVNKEQVEYSGVLLDAIESALDDARPAVMRTANASEPLANLTAVQMEVLRMIALGLSNAEIARRRNVRKRTAEESVQRVYAGLGITEDGERNARVIATRTYVRAFGMPTDDEGSPA